MIFDVVERAHTVTVANLDTDLAALCTAKGVTAPASLNVVMRQRAETFLRLNATLPAVGVYAGAADSAAKHQGTRDNVVVISWDAYLTHTNPTLLAQQTELVAEAILRTIDRLADGTHSVYGAAELPRSIQIQLTEGYEEAAEGVYFHRAVVTAPVNDEDLGV